MTETKARRDGSRGFEDAERKETITWLHAEHLLAEAETLEEIACQLSQEGNELPAIKLRGSARRLRITADGLRYVL